MQMSKNVNNDVSKDPPIPSQSKLVVISTNQNRDQNQSWLGLRKFSRARHTLHDFAMSFVCFIRHFLISSFLRLVRSTHMTATLNSFRKSSHHSTL